MFAIARPSVNISPTFPTRPGLHWPTAHTNALFTMVGIAGEDDLDAPDLPPMRLNGGTADRAYTETMNRPAEVAAVPYARPKENGAHHKIIRGAASMSLPPDQSAALRDRLAVLSDALEEVGCNSVDILDHLRSPGPHVRGCHVLDLILGKE